MPTLRARSRQNASLESEDSDEEDQLVDDNGFLPNTKHHSFMAIGTLPGQNPASSIELPDSSNAETDGSFALLMPNGDIRNPSAQAFKDRVFVPTTDYHRWVIDRAGRAILRRVHPHNYTLVELGKVYGLNHNPIGIVIKNAHNPRDDVTQDPLFLPADIVREFPYLPPVASKTRTHKADARTSRRTVVKAGTSKRVTRIARASTTARHTKPCHHRSSSSLDDGAILMTIVRTVLTSHIVAHTRSPPQITTVLPRMLSRTKGQDDAGNEASNSAPARTDNNAPPKNNSVLPIVVEVQSTHDTPNAASTGAPAHLAAPDGSAGVQHFLSNVRRFNMSDWKETFSESGFKSMQEVRTVADLPKSELREIIDDLFTSDVCLEVNVILVIIHSCPVRVFLLSLALGHLFLAMYDAVAYLESKPSGVDYMNKLPVELLTMLLLACCGPYFAAFREFVSTRRALYMVCSRWFRIIHTNRVFWTSIRVNRGQSIRHLNYLFYKSRKPPGVVFQTLSSSLSSVVLGILPFDFDTLPPLPNLTQLVFRDMASRDFPSLHNLLRLLRSTPNVRDLAFDRAGFLDVPLDSEPLYVFENVAELHVDLHSDSSVANLLRHFIFPVLGSLFLSLSSAMDIALLLPCVQLLKTVTALHLDGNEPSVSELHALFSSVPLLKEFQAPFLGLPVLDSLRNAILLHISRDGAGVPLPHLTTLGVGGLGPQDVLSFVDAWIHAKPHGLCTIKLWNAPILFPSQPSGEAVSLEPAEIALSRLVKVEYGISYPVARWHFNLVALPP
ncbi:hypothetical protein C8R43DRAFT_949094 [Mycena crocata]|nr:hypothetical protein C8R43DRAFT_949094 [Mycena crocata]